MTLSKKDVIELIKSNRQASSPASGTITLNYIRFKALAPANWPAAVAGEARVFYCTDGQLRIQHPAGSPEIIVTTPPGSDGL